MTRSERLLRTTLLRDEEHSARPTHTHRRRHSHAPAPARRQEQAQEREREQGTVLDEQRGSILFRSALSSPAIVRHEMGMCAPQGQGQGLEQGHGLEQGQRQELCYGGCGDTEAGYGQRVVGDGDVTGARARGGTSDCLVSRVWAAC
ncbi:hypothetical protein H0H81_005219 [Sphagnurus paluster]|uniref:Uncharacterized protein n=1 Tax=Sphagnurus paluster TaxID=117069 RepID=A0A9P7FXW1_9AGAR|nr:hypothetical protein H0H81_005219 [Sphagnurus paluster]